MVPMSGNDPVLVMIARHLSAGIAIFLFTSVASADTTISEPRDDGHHLVTYTINSEYQHGPNALRILLPAKFDSTKKYPVLYVLPVAAGPDEDHQKWGNGVDAIRGGKANSDRPNLADQYGLICVFPVFDTTPWYGDNPLNSKIRHESYLLKVVLPLVEQKYPVISGRRGRMLLGFSKSGWGAFSLLLRHPDIFGKAAAWDAPMMVEWPGNWGIAEQFGAQDAFDQSRIPPLLASRADELKSEKRLILIGYGNFREHTLQAHALMEKLGIPHEYRDGPERAHHWYSGWVAEAVQMLMDQER